VGVGNQISLGLFSNGVPHVVILFLNLASFRSILFLNLDGPEQILPNVLDIGGVPEGQNSVILINGDNRPDGLNIFLDDSASERLVGLIASNAGPGHGLLFTAHFQGIQKGDLLFVGQRAGVDGEECQQQNDCCFHFVMNLIIIHSNNRQ
jgi:hypothetical protein